MRPLRTALSKSQTIRQANEYPSLTYHDGLLLMAAINARDHARRDLEARAIGSLQTDALSAIVLSAAAAESFINELPARISRPAQRGETVDAELIACAEQLIQAAQDRARTLDKYKLAKRCLTGVGFSTHSGAYRGLWAVMTLRNAIMHAKAGPPVKFRLLMRELEKRNLTTDRRICAAPDTIRLSWLNRLMDPATAEWACSAAHGIILAVLDLVYERSDELRRIRHWFCDRNKFPTGLP